MYSENSKKLACIVKAKEKSSIYKTNKRHMAAIVNPEKPRISGYGAEEKVNRMYLEFIKKA